MLFSGQYLSGCYPTTYLQYLEYRCSFSGCYFHIYFPPKGISFYFIHCSTKKYFLGRLLSSSTIYQTHINLGLSFLGNLKDFLYFFGKMYIYRCYLVRSVRFLGCDSKLLSNHTDLSNMVVLSS